MTFADLKRHFSNKKDHQGHPNIFATRPWQSSNFEESHNTLKCGTSGILSPTWMSLFGPTWLTWPSISEQNLNTTGTSSKDILREIHIICHITVIVKSIKLREMVFTEWTIHIMIIPYFTTYNGQFNPLVFCYKWRNIILQDWSDCCKML